MGASALTACADLDTALFGDESSASASDAAFPAADAGAPPTASASNNVSVPMPPPAGATPAGAAPVATITPVTIASGADTGTQVNKTIQAIRAQVAGLQQKITANAGRLADLRTAPTRYSARAARLEQYSL